MNNIKQLKPNLLDPILVKKINKTLNPPIEDYWEPTRNTARSFFENYIKPNAILFILFLVFILFLFYRYQVIKKNREETELVDLYQKQLYQTVINNDPTNRAQYVQNNNLDQRAQLFLNLYEEQKNIMREPIYRKYSNRMKPVQVNSPNFAYPMYPQ